MDKKEQLEKIIKETKDLLIKKFEKGINKAETPQEMCLVSAKITLILYAMIQYTINKAEERKEKQEEDIDNKIKEIMEKINNKIDNGGN